MRLNKKAVEMSSGAIIVIILCIVVLLFYLFVFTGTANAGFKAVSCTEQKGVCKPECEASDTQYYYDFKRNCGVNKDGVDNTKNPKCCIPKEETVTQTGSNLQCVSATPGVTTCGVDAAEKLSHVCDDAHQCVTRCEFCARNPKSNLCKYTINGKPVQFNDRWICGCDDIPTPAPGGVGSPTPGLCTQMYGSDPPTCFKTTAVFTGTAPAPSKVMCDSAANTAFCCYRP